MSTPDDVNTDGTTGEGAAAAEAAETTPQDKAEAGQLAALKAERAKRQAAEQRLAELEAAQQAAEQKAAEQRGEFEGLYKTEKQRAEELAAKVSTYEARESARVEALTARNTARIDGLSDALKALVPDGLDADATAAWLDRAAQVQTEPQLAAGTRSRGGTTVTIPQPCIAAAARVGKDTSDPAAMERWFQMWKDWPEGKAYYAAQGTS